MSFKLNTELVNTAAVVEAAAPEITATAEAAVAKTVEPIHEGIIISFGTAGDFETYHSGYLTWDSGVAYQNHPDHNNITQIKQNKGFKVKASAGATLTATFYSEYGQYFLVDGVRVTSDVYTVVIATDKEIYITTDHKGGAYIISLYISQTNLSVNDVLFNKTKALDLYGVSIGYNNNIEASNGLINYGNTYLIGDFEAESRKPHDLTQSATNFSRINVDSNMHGGAKFSSCVLDDNDSFAKFKISTGGTDQGDADHKPLIQMLVQDEKNSANDDWSQAVIGTRYAKLETHREDGDSVVQTIDLGVSDERKMILSINQDDSSGVNLISKITLDRRELKMEARGSSDGDVTYEHVFKLNAHDSRPKFSNDNEQNWHDIALTDDAKSRLVKVRLINVGPSIRTNINLTFVVYNQSTEITSLAALLAADYVFIDGVYITDDESGMTEYTYYEPVVNISTSSDKMSVYCYTYGHDESSNNKTYKNCTIYSVPYAAYSITVTDTI